MRVVVPGLQGLDEIPVSFTVKLAVDVRLVNVNVAVPTFLNVTFVLLFVFGKVGLNMTGLGVNDTGSPSPLTASVRNVFPFASAGNVVLTVPLGLPDTVGEKIT